MKKSNRIPLVLFLALSIGRMVAADAELAALRDQVRQLEQQLSTLARHVKAKEEEASAAAKTGSKVSINDKGLALASNDGATALKLRALVQFDSRVFLGDQGVANDFFLLRRARLSTEGSFARVCSFQIIPEFAGGAVTLLDASLAVALSKQVQLRFGKFKPPVGLELLQADPATFFMERSLVTNLVPLRDLGVQVSGDLWRERLSYSVGVFAGAADGVVAGNSDFDNGKDVAVRLFASPFKEQAESPLRGLSFGVGGSYGLRETASGRAPAYRTEGQQIFFAYSGAVVADGASWRLSPQVSYRRGPLGVMAEYALSAAEVRTNVSGPKARLVHDGLNISVGYAVTGDQSSYAGLQPRNNFDLAEGTWGALELVARYSEFGVDDGTFPRFAPLAGNASGARAIGLGANWYLNRSVRFMINGYQTRFNLPPGAAQPALNSILRQDENVLLTRFQVAF